MQHGHDCMAQATGTYVLAAANSNFDDPGRHSSFIPPPQPGTRSDYEHQLLVHQSQIVLATGAQQATQMAAWAICIPARPTARAQAHRSASEPAATCASTGGGSTSRGSAPPAARRSAAAASSGPSGAAGASAATRLGGAGGPRQRTASPLAACHMLEAAGPVDTRPRVPVNQPAGARPLPAPPGLASPVGRAVHAY